MTTPNSFEAGSVTAGQPDSSGTPASLSEDSATLFTALHLSSPSEPSTECETSENASNPLPSSLSAAGEKQLEISLTSDGQRCYSCRRFMPLGAFAKAVIKGTEYRVKRCNPCRAYRQKHSPKLQQRKAMLAEAKAKPCAQCGGTFPPECMDFDHVHGPRAFLVSSAFSWKRLDALKAELEKCELVCANCHRIRTKQRGQHVGRPNKYLAEVPFDPKYVDPIVSNKGFRQQT